MERAEVRFNNLCVEDKLRLQKLIKELATASQQLNQKNERIEKLEIDLAEKQKEQAKINLERKGTAAQPTLIFGRPMLMNLFQKRWKKQRE